MASITLIMIQSSDWKTYAAIGAGAFICQDAIKSVAKIVTVGVVGAVIADAVGDAIKPAPSYQHLSVTTTSQRLRIGDRDN